MHYKRSHTTIYIKSFGQCQTLKECDISSKILTLKNKLNLITLPLSQNGTSSNKHILEELLCFNNPVLVGSIKPRFSVKILSEKGQKNSKMKNS